MTLAKSPTNQFMLQASDREPRRPVLQARFEVSDLRALQTLLGAGGR